MQVSRNTAVPVAAAKFVAFNRDMQKKGNTFSGALERQIVTTKGFRRVVARQCRYPRVSCFRGFFGGGNIQVPGSLSAIAFALS